MSRRERERDRDRERGRDRNRDGRDSETKRRHAGFDRELSLKRSRRDTKPEAERVVKPSTSNLDGVDDNQKQRKRLLDALPLEPPPADSGAKETEKKSNGHDSDGSKHVPHSRSYFQHDERGNAGQAGRSLNQRGATERERRSRDSKDDRTESVAGKSANDDSRERRSRDSKDDRTESVAGKSANDDSRQRDDKPRAKAGENGNAVWGHDGFHELEIEPTPRVRKRPAFREQKMPVENENYRKATAEPVRSNHSNHPVSSSGRREERDRNPRHLDRFERPSARGGDFQRGGLPSRDRYGGGGSNYSGRDRFNGRQTDNPSVSRGEKWKHDLFDEANRSPAAKSEEEQIAKVEALLAS